MGTAWRLFQSLCALMAVSLLARLPLANATIIFAPLSSLQDALRVVSSLDSFGIEALVQSEGLTQACLHAAPLLREACGLSGLHVADIGDMVSRVFKSLRAASISQSTHALEIAATTATTCSCGGLLSCVHTNAVTANVQGIGGSRAVLHVPKRCTRRSGQQPCCRSYHWFNYMVSSTSHLLRGDVRRAPFFFINAREGFDLSYLQVLRLRVCRLHATFLGEADIAHLQTKLYGSAAPPWGSSFRQLLQQAYFMWNAARSAQEMFLHDAPDADPSMACVRYPFDLRASSESQLALFWESYNTHWHRKWCAEHAQHHRRVVRVEISDALAEQLQLLVDSSACNVRTIANALCRLAGTPGSTELSAVCAEHEVPRSTAIVEAVTLSSLDEDSGCTLAAEMVLFMDKVGHPTPTMANSSAQSWDTHSLLFFLLNNWCLEQVLIVLDSQHLS